MEVLKEKKIKLEASQSNKDAKHSHADSVLSKNVALKVEEDITETCTTPTRTKRKSTLTEEQLNDIDTLDSKKQRAIQKRTLDKDSKDYKRMRDLANARKRKFLNKMSEEQHEIRRAKDREYHRRKKRTGQIKPINCIPKREQTEIRKRWRKAAERYRYKKKLAKLILTPPETEAGEDNINKVSMQQNKKDMASCGAMNCQHNNLRNTCSFFRLPMEPVLRADWLRTLRRDPNTVPKVMFVCSCHFRDGRKENGPELYVVNENFDVGEFDLPSSKNLRGKRQTHVQNATEFGLAKLRATATDLEAEPSTSAASNDDYEFEIKSDLPIEHVDVGSVSTSCEEQSDSNLDFLPESEEPPLPKYQRTVPSAPKDMKSYCRLCLNPVTKVQMICLGDFHDINYPSRTVQFKRNKILQTDMYLRMIRTLLPNFDHDLVYNPVMCNDCSTRLQMASDFVEQCMATQKLIQQYKDTNCPLEKMVSCEDVVYSKSQLQPNSEEGPSQPKQRKIATRPSKSIAKSKSTVKPQRETRSVLPETQTVSPADEILMSGNVSIKMEDIDDEEMQIEEKYEITQEEICYIKQECVEEAPRIQTDDVTIKTEPEHPLPTNSVIKSEPCLDSTVTPDPISVKEFSTTDASCNVNDKLSSLVELPSQLSSTVPISNSPDLNQVLVPETCISAVNSKGFSSVNSQFENSQNR